MTQTNTRPIIPENASVATSLSKDGLYQAPDLSQSTIWGRVAIAGGTVGFGGLVLTLGAMATQYRLNYFSVDNAIVNGQTIEVRSPIEGSISSFEVKPGSEVQTGQVLAKVKPAATIDTTTVKLEGELNVLRSKQTQTQQTLSLLNSQLSGLAQQEFQLITQQDQITAQGQSVNVAKVSAATIDLRQNDAHINSATAKVTAAKVDYDRYAELAAQGGISQQKVSQMKAIWDVAEADLAQANAAKASAVASIDALQDAAPLPVLSMPLQAQRLSLTQMIQDQTANLNRLAAEITAQQLQLKVHQAELKLKSAETELKAPIQGKVFRTASTLGEQVNRSTPLMTVVDCQNRWVEAFIPANQVSRINRSQPVQILVEGKSQPMMGEIESLNGVNPDELKQQTQAVFPMVPTNLNGQVPAHVIVKLINNQDIPITQNMCGIGQSVKITFSTQGISL